MAAHDVLSPDGFVEALTQLEPREAAVLAAVVRGFLLDEPRQTLVIPYADLARELSMEVGAVEGAIARLESVGVLKRSPVVEVSVKARWWR